MEVRKGSAASQALLLFCLVILVRTSVAATASPPPNPPPPPPSTGEYNGFLEKVLRASYCVLTKISLSCSFVN